MTLAKRTAAALFVVSLASMGSVGRALADDAGCDPPVELGPSEVTPADRAMNVPRNAIIRVRYSPGYFAGAVAPTETITLTGPSGAVAGGTQLVGDDTLYFVPNATLQASSEYTGVATGAVFPFDFRFTTGSLSDVARPDFGDPKVSADFALKASATDDCRGPDGRRVRLTFPAAQDDGPTSSIEYWIYLTRAEGLDAPVLMTRIRDYGTATVTAGFLLTHEQSQRAACVTVVAVDGLDRATEWPSAECLDPTGGLGFVGLCTVRPGESSASAPFSMVVAVAVLAGRRLRRRVLR